MTNGAGFRCVSGGLCCLQVPDRLTSLVKSAFVSMGCTEEVHPERTMTDRTESVAIVFMRLSLRWIRTGGLWRGLVLRRCCRGVFGQQYTRQYTENRQRMGSQNPQPTARASAANGPLGANRCSGSGWVLRGVLRSPEAYAWPDRRQHRQTHRGTGLRHATADGVFRYLLGATRPNGRLGVGQTRLTAILTGH